MGWLSGIGGVVADTVIENLTESGNYGSLHKSLIAVIKPCTVDGAILGTDSVKAPLKDGQFEQSFNWNSPFENLTPDQRNPMLSQMATSQGFTQVEQLLGELGSGDSATVSGAAGKALSGAVSGAMASTGMSEFLEAAQGRSTITKLNSRQVYAGHEPLKLNLTLVFRAYADPYKEVEVPVMKLLKFAYPQKMANSYVDSLKEYNQANSADGVDAKKMAVIMFPSEAPQFVSLTYKGKTYAPLVIESISLNLDDPSSLTGDVFKEVQLSLASLHALDAADIERFSKTSMGNAVSKLTNQAVNAVSKLFKE